MSTIHRVHWSRRSVLEGALLTAACGRIPSLAAAADADAVNAALKLPLITKRIPVTGERIPAIGMGTNAFRLENYTELRAVLQRMQQMGGAVIDTSDDYPNPSIEESELVIGRALGELAIRNRMFLVTKFNADGYQSPGTPRDNVFGQVAFDRSLLRLQTDKIDVQFVHHLPSVEPLMPVLRDIKKSGRARYIGITTQRLDEHELLAQKMAQHPIDFIEVDYSIANRDAAATILPLAMKRKVAVMVDIPFGGRRGPLLPGLAGKPLPPWAVDIDVASWSQFLLKYVISHPAVTCVIPGSTKVEHLVDNQLAGRGRLPDQAMRIRMEEYWDAMA